MSGLRFDEAIQLITNQCASAKQRAENQWIESSVVDFIQQRVQAVPMKRELLE